MDIKRPTFTHRSPEEVRDWFYRAKARIAAKEEEIRAMYEEEKILDRPVRTKEEILSWLDAARKRKEDWEKKVDAKFSERSLGKKAAAESLQNIRMIY